MGQQSALSSVPDHGQVTVITMTRRRPSLLANAIRSVAGQCCDHVAEHLILVDDCLETWGSLARELPPEVRPRMVPRGPADATGPRRLGHLRDIGAGLARTPWVAYLDDDDEWLPSHLASSNPCARR
jgi:glycosyltransferase involved in cell wall biosynthesis